METITLNHELKLICPDGFAVLSDAELAQMNSYKEPPKWCAKDAERHMIMAVSWAEKRGFFGAIADIEDVTRANEKMLKKAMRPFGYCLDRIRPS